MDCWTYYENALAFARMLRYKPGPYTPQDMLHMVELERSTATAAAPAVT
jgi:hypothetical protein